jgi:hypothetical protein
LKETLVTNRELLKASKEALGAVDRQRQHLLRVELTAVPCPACLTPVNALSAAGIDIDAYSFGAEEPTYCCPHCLAHLEQVVPLFPVGPGWLWQLNHNWLAERLHKAELFEQREGIPAQELESRTVMELLALCQEATRLLPHAHQLAVDASPLSEAFVPGEEIPSQYLALLQRMEEMIARMKGSEQGPASTAAEPA